MNTVSDPQRLTINRGTIKWVVSFLCNNGLDPHEFATEYANRTALLGYAPSISLSLKEFVNERSVSIA